MAFAAAAFCVLAAPAGAHPLGNFTINHLAKVRIAGSALQIRYVLDIAEIPTFQIMRDRAPEGGWNDRIAQAWADSELAVVLGSLTVNVDGRRAALTSSGVHVRTRPGAGGLPILYWTADFTGDLGAARAHDIVVDDRVYRDRRIGWKDIAVAPAVEPTKELLSYPSALIASPRSITTATFHVNASGAVSNVRLEDAAVAPQPSTASAFSQTLLSEMFLRTDQGPLWIFITILAAFGFGALHAIEPGHGKALLAFTLVGARATSKQAAILAASLTFAHTIGVLLLGIGLFFVAGFVPETIYPWITLVSGVAITAIGARALSRYLRGLRPFAHAHAHAHPHAHPHDHAHDHGHDAAHAHAQGHDHLHPVGEQIHSHGGVEHSHAIPGTRPLNFGSAVWAAMSGGIAPCPAAIILLIAAVNSHRIGYGLLLIVIFGLGLASVLTGLGLAVVRGAAWISRNAKYERVVRFGPLASAALISIVGSVLLGQGFAQVGIAANALLVALLALAAIGGYAFVTVSHRHVSAQPA